MEEKEYQIEEAEEHFDDKEFMMDAINHKASWVLAYASERLLIIKYASKELRGDKDVAMAAITQSKDAKIYLTDEILKDKDIDLILNPPPEEENK